MAHAAKYTKAAAGHMTRHYDRTADNISNEKIIPELSGTNYNLGPHRDGTQMEFINKRCSEVKCLNRKDVNVMCSWAVTMPQTLHPYEHERFFKAAYEFLVDRYGGEKNVISAYVHMDETTPHMHFAFVPVVTDKKKGIEKVAAKEAIDRTDLQSFHTDFDERMTQVFGRDIGVMSEATKEGNKTVAELKRETAMEQQLELIERNSELQESIESKMAQISDLEAEFSNKKKNLDLAHEKYASKLQGKIEALEGQVKALETKKDILTAAEVEALKGERNIVGGLKGVTFKEYEALKATAAKVESMEQEKNKAEKKAKETDNRATVAEKRAKDAYSDANRKLAAKVHEIEQDRPSMKMQLENVKLRKENEILQAALSRLPQEIREEIMRTKTTRSQGVDRGR